MLFYLLDGARPDILSKLIADGQLPHLKLLTEEGSFRTATTCFPSTTGPAYLPFLTGHFPGTMNIPGIRWFDKAEFKRTRWNRMAMRSYCGPEAGLFNTDMPADKPTLFELAGESYNLYNMITRNVPDKYDLGKKGKSWLYMRAHFMKRHHPVDQQGHERIMRLLKSGKDFDFLFAVFPSVDWDSHYHDIQDSRTIEAYRIADNSIGEVRALLEKKGWWKDTLFLLTCDHGLTQSHTHFDLGDWMTARGLKSVSYPIISRRKPQSAVMISGNSFGSVHLLDHTGSHALHHQELVCCLGETRLQELLAQPAVDFVTMRGDQPNSYWIINHVGRGMVSYQKEVYRYQPISADPLRLGDVHADGHRKALEMTVEGACPDALFQIEQLFRSKRAGDFVVSAANGYDLRDFWEFPEHRGSHGSLSREHMTVPLLYNQKNWANHATRTADLFPTILKWLGKRAVPSEGTSLI